MTSPDAFFAYARERHAVHLRRASGQKAPWTTDPVLQSNRFCNVYRELDRTTAWFRQHVRGPMANSPDVLLATVVFRWFNRISTGEAIFCQPYLDGRTAFEAWARDGESILVLKESILRLCGSGPYVTGAYTINTNTCALGTSKLDGVLQIIAKWVETHPDWREVALDRMGRGVVEVTLQGFCDWCRSPNLGPFMTYEVACDLRHTALLRRAKDLCWWANLGPGARRGLNRIFRGLTGRAADAAIPDDDAQDEMRQLLKLSRDARYWPKGRQGVAMELGLGYADKFKAELCLMDPRAWPRWEMREVEHTLCEFDKYLRIRAGEGRSRGSFDGRGR
jgi:hypothetical protein